MSKVAIVTDSNSGITQSEAKEYGVTAVSYTHLDVYKRQMWRTALQWETEPRK